MVEAVAPARRFSLRKIPGAVWGLIALALGLTLGTFFPTQFGFIGAAVKTGFRGLAWAAPFIIYFTISAAIVDMMRHGKSGRFALWVSLVFTAVGIAAAVLAIFLTVPLLGLAWSSGDANFADTLKTIGVETILLTHSSRSFIAVFYAAGTSVGLYHLAKWKGAAWFANPTMDVIGYIGRDGIQLVGRAFKVAFPYVLFGIGIFIPSAIESAVASTETGVASAGGASGAVSSVVGSNPVALYFLTVWLQVVILAVFMIIATTFVCWWTGFSIKRFFKEYFAYVYPFAWATSSSDASIPVNLERSGEGLGVRKEVREFIIPLGATVNLDGAIMASFLLTAMASILVGYTPTFVDLLILLIPIKIVTLGVPGIPGGIAAVVPPVVAGIMPIPPGSEAAFMAIWFGFSVGLSDQFRTGVNTTTNGIVALGFEHVYDKYFAKDVAEGGAVTTAGAPSAQTGDDGALVAESGGK